jgi:hypothetical protein
VEAAVGRLLRLCHEVVLVDSSRNLAKVCQRALRAVQRCLFVGADAIGVQGPISQNSISAEKSFSDKFTSSNFGQIATQLN